jgi:gamma-polyglutamate biosynthesis protein CapA
MHEKIANPTPNVWVITLIALASLVIIISAAVRSSNQSVSTSTPIRLQSDIEGDVSEVTEETQSVPTPNVSERTLIFGGDLQFDRHIRQVGERRGYTYILEPLTELLTAADLVVANLEGPVTTYASKSLGSAVGSTNNYIFTFSPEVVTTLQQYHIGVVNLGNNHILNFGTDGVVQTKAFLTENKIGHFGNTGGSSWLEDSFYTFTWENSSILFVNYNQFLETDTDLLLQEIRARDAHHTVVIMYTHWGTEYTPTAGTYYQDLAHQFIAAGVDLIIGSHPHVVQQKEVYMGKTIYYSLGNFVFDQYFSRETQSGLLVRVTVLPEGITKLEEIPIFMEATGQTFVLGEQ